MKGANWIDRLFDFLTAPFAVLARGCRAVNYGASARAARLERSLDFRKAVPDAASLPPSSSIWHSVGPLLTFVGVDLVALGDAVLYGLRWGALLDPRNLLGIEAPRDLHVWAVTSWIGTIAIWGAAAWDLSRAMPTLLPYSNLGRWARTALGGLSVLALALCLLAAAVFFVSGQEIIERGERDRDLAVLFSGLFALMSVGALLVGSWSVVVAVVAALSWFFAAVALLFALLYFLPALVVIVLDKAAAVLWPFGSHNPIAPDITLGGLGGGQESHSLEVTEMSLTDREVFVFGRGALAEAGVPLLGPPNMVRARALFSLGASHPDLTKGGVLDLSLPPETVRATLLNVGGREEALEVLREIWVELLLSNLGGGQQGFYIESVPLEDAAWTEALLRELKRRRPNLEIAAITSLPEPDQRVGATPPPAPLFTRLRSEGVLNAVFVIDPCSPLGQRYGWKLQLAALLNAMGGLLSAQEGEQTRREVSEIVSRIGAGGDVFLSFATNAVDAGRRGFFPKAFNLQRGYGDIGDLVSQVREAAQRAASETKCSAAPEGALPDAGAAAFFVCNLPLRGGDRRRDAVEDQTAPWIRAHVSQQAIVIPACAPGLRLPDTVGSYVTSVAVLFHKAAPPPSTASSDGRRAQEDVPRARRQAASAVKEALA